jgi:hypothetical protein
MQSILFLRTTTHHSILVFLSWHCSKRKKGTTKGIQQRMPPTTKGNNYNECLLVLNSWLTRMDGWADGRTDEFGNGHRSFKVRSQREVGSSVGASVRHACRTLLAYHFENSGLNVNLINCRTVGSAERLMTKPLDFPSPKYLMYVDETGP